MPSTPNNRTSEKAIAEKRRTARAIELRMAGFTYDSIAEQLGYASKSGASHAVHRALTRMIREPTEQLRDLELDRLDTLQRSLWSVARGGDVAAVDRILKIMERRAKLLGLDRATIALTGPNDGPIMIMPVMQLDALSTDELADLDRLLNKGAAHGHGNTPPA